MATASDGLSAANIDAALLAALKIAAPEQIGDDLVLRLADGRVFYIDGFFAAAEVGDGRPPEPGAIPLGPDIADLLLGPGDFATAAGGEEAPTPPSSGTGFQPFPSGSTQAPEFAQGSSGENGLAEEEPRAPNDDDDARSRGGQYTPQQDLGGGGQFGAAGALGLSAIGAVSLAAGSADGPPWSGFFDIRMLFAVEDLTDPQVEGWFYGFSKAKALVDPVGLQTFSKWFDPTDTRSPDDLAHNYDLYLDTHLDLATYADGRSIWANILPYAEVFGTRDNTDDHAVPIGQASPAVVFGQGDMIIGCDYGVDNLHGYDGNDILIGFGGENHLFGDAGDDVLSFGQDSSPLTVDGGAGTDTLLMVINRPTFPIIAKDIGAITSIERMVLLLEDPSNPVFLNDDFGAGRILPGNLVLVLDAQTILAWGGTLAIDSSVADIRLSDIDIWTRLPADPADPEHVHYQAQIGADLVKLSILASADQPIADLVSGTSGDDLFFLGDRKFDRFDGGLGNDQILGGLDGGSTGKLDLSDPGTTPFRNIENIALFLPTDQLILSAASIAAMTDTRKTLWVAGPEYNSGRGAGDVDLLDPTQWSALGYMSVLTYDDTVDDQKDQTRIGAIYGSTVSGSNVYLFVQLGMEQPIVGNIAALDHWFVGHSGWVHLPPTATIAGLSVIDSTNASANFLMLDAAAVADLSGPDRSVSIIGDGAIDVVEFSDNLAWKFSRTEGDFTVYEGDDGSGQPVELRIASSLVQPFVLPDPGVGDIDMSNGHFNKLTLSAESATEQAGADKLLSIYGDKDDSVVFSDPQNWHLAGSNAGFYVYTGDDGKGHSMELQIDTDLQHPTLLPVGTNANDVLYVTNERFLGAPDVIDGKDGVDILHILDSGYIFSATHILHGVEVIDLGNGYVNQLDVGALDLVNNSVSGPLFVTGDTGDAVTISDPARWTDTGTTITNATVSANSFELYQAVYHTAGGDVTVQLAVDMALTQPVLV